MNISEVVFNTALPAITPSANFCNQVTDLKNLGYSGTWYMVSAIQAHEQVHETRLLPALANITPLVESEIEALSVPYTGQTSAQAILQLKALPAFNTALTNAYDLWYNEYISLMLLAGDHAAGGPTETAERAIVLPMASTICAHAITSGWPTCTSCP